MIITLLSDLGDNTPYLAWAESRLATVFPHARIITISNKVAPFKITQAAYLWKCSAGRFPIDTFHISLVDLVMSLPAQVMICEHQDSYYLGIDNGLLTASFALGNQPYYIYNQTASNFSNFMEHICESIRQLQLSKLSSKSLLSYQPLKLYEFPKILIRENSIDCVIVFIDAYENAITNLHKEEFEKICNNRLYSLQFLRNETISKISDGYRDSENGGTVAYFNEFGYLQISMKSKNAQSASMLGLSEYHSKSMINNSIRINFN